jgi:ketosteroid isomerase-like protein
VYAGAVTRNPDAFAALFTEDGVFEAPLVPGVRLTGRAEIREGIVALQSDMPGVVNLAESSYVLHETQDPDVFIAEIDTVLDGPDGHRARMSLVQIFRLRDGRIRHLRDYFHEPIPARAP